MTLVYGFVICFIFVKRNEYPIYNRSPKLIIIGGLGNSLNILYLLGLLLDAVSNVGIASMEKPSFQCFLSIVCTLVFHYASYVSIYIR